MANRYFKQFYYTFHTKPVQLDCNFVVDSSNGNGLGIRNLKGPGIANVFMHTSATPAAGNPNPQPGIILVQLQDSYSRYYFGTAGFVAPLSGSSLVVTAVGAALTIGDAYTITSVGTSTASDWVTLGVPVGIVPAPGVTFIALATGSGTGSGTVQAPSATGSGISHVELIGDPNQTLQYYGGQVMGIKGGAYIVSGCYAATNSTTTTAVLTAPANGTVIGLSMVLSSSSIVQQGE